MFEAEFDSCDNFEELAFELAARERLDETIKKRAEEEEENQQAIDNKIIKNLKNDAKKLKRIYANEEAHDKFNEAWLLSPTSKKIVKAETEREKRQMDFNTTNDEFDEPFSNMEEVDGGRRKTKRLKRSKPFTRTKNSAKK